MNEIEESLRREAKQGGEMLVIPITLDGFIFGYEWKPPDQGTVEALRARVIGDFRGADKDGAKFIRELGRLLKALRKPSAPGATGGGGP